MTSRYAYSDSRGYHFCDGIRSVTKTGEMLPHAGGEVTLTVEGLESPVRAGYSSTCTHAFITSAAIAQSTHECHKLKPMKCVVHCPMGVTLRALGTIRLPVVMPRGQSASLDGPRAEDSPRSQASSEGSGDDEHTPGEAVGCKEGGDQTCGHGTVVTVPFVVVEGRTKECMLDRKTLERLGLRPQDLAQPSHPLKDPSLEFQRACIAVQRARDPMKVMAYYPVPEGARKPVLTFGIGQDVMRTVKGVLVMLQDGGDKDEPRLMTRLVLDGPGLNVVIKSEVEDHHVPKETEWQDLPKVEPRPLKILEECAKRDRRPRAPVETAAPAQTEATKLSPRKPQKPVGDFAVPAWWTAVEGLLFLQDYVEDAWAPSDHSNSGANGGSSAGGGRASHGISSALASIGSIVTAGPPTAPTLSHLLSLRQDTTTTSTIIQASLRRGACGQGARVEGGSAGGHKRTRVTVTVEEGRVEHKRGKSQLANGCR